MNKKNEFPVTATEAGKMRDKFEQPEIFFPKAHADACEFAKLVAIEMGKKDVRTAGTLADIVIDLLRRIKPEGLKSSDNVKKPLSSMHPDEVIIFVVSAFTPMCGEALSLEFQEAVSDLILKAMGRSL